MLHRTAVDAILNRAMSTICAATVFLATVVITAAGLIAQAPEQNRPDAVPRDPIAVVLAASRSIPSWHWGSLGTEISRVTSCACGVAVFTRMTLNPSDRPVRTVPIPTWVKAAVDAWTVAAGITHGPVFRAINKAGRVWGDGMSPKVLWDVVPAAAARAGIDKLAPHDLRRTCARLCHLAGGELDEIQFLLGHVSIQTTERYLGCKQKLRVAVNDRLGIEPDAA